MKLPATLALTGGALAVDSTKSGPGASGNTPGHEMQERGSKAGSPGASGYAPGHEMKGDTTGTTKGMTGTSGGGMTKGGTGTTSGSSSGPTAR